MLAPWHGARCAPPPSAATAAPRPLPPVAGIAPHPHPLPSRCGHAAAANTTRYTAELQFYAAAFQKAIENKQADDEMWLKFNTILDCARFVVLSVNVLNGDVASRGASIDSLKGVSSDIRQLSDPSLKPVLPSEMATLDIDPRWGWGGLDRGT